MKSKKYILFTAGRGPVECGLAVQGIQKKFKNFLDENMIDFVIRSQQKGNHFRTIDTIVFEINTCDASLIKQWLGTIQWICKSPIRKFSKRKNWFIKCEEIFFSEQSSFSSGDISFQSFRGSGPGGQHRNKVETAVRLTHHTSGITVTTTDGKSQAQNRKKAMMKLKSKLDSFNQKQMENDCADQWNSQIQIERGNPVKTFYGLKFKERK